MFLPNRQKNRIHFIYGGFTLIELLVVISIIAVLSSIILVSLQDARDKARISAGIQHNSSIYQRYGNDLVGWWNFETKTGNCAKNEITGNCDVITSPSAISIPSSKGIDGGNFFYFKSLAAYPYINIPIFDPALFQGFTFSAWVYNIDCGASCDSVHDIFYTYWRLQNNQLKTYSIPAGSFCETDSGTVPNDRWVFIATTFDRKTNTVNHYVDGKLSKTCSSFSISSTLKIDKISGRSSPSVTNRFNGYLDDLRIYGEAIGMAQIQKIYAEGAVEHNLALNKNVP